MIKLEIFKIKKDKDGYINRDELKIGCSNAGCPVADNLLDLVMRDCDYDRDGKIGFLEFCNFLCYKDSMKTGIIQQANGIQFKTNN